jgi:hypothetical protein
MAGEMLTKEKESLLTWIQISGKSSKHYFSYTFETVHNKQNLLITGTSSHLIILKHQLIQVLFLTQAPQLDFIHHYSRLTNHHT